MADATATETEKITSDVQIEDIGPAAKRLTITIPPAVVAEKLEEALGTLSAETALPGFRKGRAPRALLEKRFGTALRTETRNQLVAGAYATAVETHALRPVGEPEPVDKLDDLEVVEGRPLTFRLDVEVVPEFELPGYEGIEIKKPMLDITDQHVDRELRRYQARLGEVDRIDGDFRPGDRLIGKARVTRKGDQEPFFSHDQVVIIHPGSESGGQGQVLGLLVEDLGSRLDAAKVTDCITIETKGPQGHEREDIRGADLTIEYEIKQAERIDPAPVAAVIEALGLGTEELLREQIRMALEQRRDEEQAAAMRQQVAEHLVDTIEFELPRKLSERQVARTLERYRLELLYQGLSAEDVEDRLAQVRADSEENARRRLKLYFLLRRLADHFGIEVSEQETNGRVAAMAARRGVRPEQLMNELKQSGRIAEVKAQIQENRALDRVVHHARIEEVSAEEWRRLEDEHRRTADERSAPRKKTTSSKKAAPAAEQKAPRKKAPAKKG
jgi:trigger factor